MLKYQDFLSESLAAEVKTEPKTAAAKEARKLGLTYMGFGRYADNEGKIAYLVDNDRLVPYKRQQEVQSMYSKSIAPSAQAKNVKGQATNTKNQASNDAMFYASAVNSRQKEDQKIVKQKSKETIELNKALYNFYKPSLFDDAELDALQYYTSDGFGVINRYLYMGHDAGLTDAARQTTEEMVNALDSAFEETQAPFPYTVYTGLSGRYSPDKITPGGEYIFRGYISSSIDYSTAIGGFSDLSKNSSPVVLQIEIAKGQKSIYVDPLSSNSGELETLLPRGSKIKIVSGPHVMDYSIVDDTGLAPSETYISLFHCQLIEDA